MGFREVHAQAAPRRRQARRLPVRGVVQENHRLTRFAAAWARWDFARKRRSVELAIVLVAAVGAGVAYAMNRQTALMHIVQGAGLIVVLEAFITFPTIQLSSRDTELARFRERAGWLVFGVFWLLAFMTLVYGLLQAAGWA